MAFLKNLQQRPEKERKRILWTIMAVVGVILLIAWGWIVVRNIESFESERITEPIESVDFPKIYLPEIDTSGFTESLEGIDLDNINIEDELNKENGGE